MAVQLPVGFKIGNTDPIDSRIVLSKEQMLSQNDNVMPSKYFTICSDDGKIYLYDKNNEISEETGKFRLAFIDLSEDVNELKLQVQNLNNEITKKQDLLTAGNNITIEQDSEGNLVISASSSSDITVNGIGPDSEGNIQLTMEDLDQVDTIE